MVACEHIYQWSHLPIPIHKRLSPSATKVDTALCINAGLVCREMSRKHYPLHLQFQPSFHGATHNVPSVSAYIAFTAFGERLVTASVWEKFPSARGRGFNLVMPPVSVPTHVNPWYTKRQFTKLLLKGFGLAGCIPMWKSLVVGW